MKLLHCADLHLGNAPGNHDARFYDHCFQLAHVAELSVSLGVEAVLVCGDLFHQRNIEPRTLAATVEPLEALRSRGIPVIAVEGNHDKAFYTMRESWMEYLHSAGLITLLRPTYENAQPHLVPYYKGRGGIHIVGGVRFVGFGYLGSATRSRLAALSNELAPFDGFTVGLLHTGVDNLRGLDLGAITSADLEPFRGLVDYFAMGHIHSRYDNGYAFNPGAPEYVHIGEAQQPQRGFYLVTTHEDHSFQAEFLPSVTRPAKSFTLPVTELRPEQQPGSAVAACAGMPEHGVLDLELTGTTSEHALDIPGITAALEAAYSPVWAQVRDKTRPAAASTASFPLSLVDMERDVMVKLAEENGLPPEAGHLALRLCSGLLEREPPEGLFALLKQFALQTEDRPCE